MSISSVITVIVILAILAWIIYRIFRPRDNMLGKCDGANDFEDELGWDSDMRI